MLTMRSEYPVVIGVDPAASKEHAYALIEDGALRRYALADDREMRHLFEMCRPASVFCEGQWVPVKKDARTGLWRVTKRLSDAITLAQAAGGVHEMAVSRGCAFYWANPLDWQRAMLPMRKGGQGVGKPQRDKLTMMVAKALIKEAGLPDDPGLSDDEAAAICIAEYGVRQLHGERVVEAAEEKE